MKRLITILLNMLLILACILVGGAMALTCWLAPLPPGEAFLDVPGATVSWVMCPAPTPDTWHVIPDPRNLTPDTWNMTLFTEETWTTNHLA